MHPITEMNKQAFAENADFHDEYKKASELLGVLKEMEINPHAKDRGDSLLGEKKFSDNGAALQYLLTKITAVSETPLGVLPPFLITVYKDVVHSSIGLLRRFNEASSLTKEEVDEIRKKLVNDIPTLLSKLYPVLIYTRFLTEECDPISDAINRVHNLEQYFISVEKRADALLPLLQTAVNQKLAADESQEFKSIAESHLCGARIWLVATVLMVLAILFTAVTFYNHAYDLAVSDTVKEISTGVAIQLVGAKLFILSILSVTLFIFIRNYRANMHNYILSEHRASTLNSYRSFLRAIDSQSAKDQLLLKIVESAFGTRQTGYDHADRDTGHPLQQVFDMHSVLNKTNSG